MATIQVTAYDAVIDCYRLDPDLALEMADHFSYELPGAQFSPAYKRGHWDGRKKLFDLRNYTLPAGLRDAAREWCAKRGHHLHELDTPEPGEYTEAQARFFLDHIGVPARFERRDHQLRPIVSSLNHPRRLFLSPTSSGKSLVIYATARRHATKKRRVLVLVPTLGLKKQLPADFVDYGCDPELIHVAETKDPHPGPQATIVVTSWHVAIKQEQAWFEQFGCVIGDEAHLFKSDSLQEIMGRLRNCGYRYGFTGTLDGSKTNEMVLRGVFGTIEKVISTKELVDLGYVAKPRVSVLILEHPLHARAELHANQAAARKEARKAKKPAGGALLAVESDQLGRCAARNQFIARLTCRLRGATLVMFHREEHGRALEAEIRSRTGRPIYFINGGVSALEREDIRQVMLRAEDEPILLASTGTSATGMSVPRFRNLVFAASWKSRIINLQTVGRGLRKEEGKDSCEIYDISDELTHRDEENYTLRHMVERLKIFTEEAFEYNTFRVELKYD